ncbi:MAG: protein kinase domain-containing protein [Gemmatimonadaceae bacterium]
MTPERWGAVDSILQGALACEPSARATYIAKACAGDDALWSEVASLLAAHDRAGDDFLERPVGESPDAPEILTPPARRLAGVLEGHYTIECELAQGGMATVYLARDLRHDRRVAIKVLREEVAAAVGSERFLEEIRVTASLQHPHILPLFDSGNADGLLWYVMPFVEGETLRTRLAREGPLPVDTALQFARQVADALEYAHRHGVVHRDVKPENVLLQDGHAVVADFGIALALEHAGGERLTRTGIMIGTPQYMAPEQADGQRAVDERADVYALGAVLYEMLVGKTPHAASAQATPLVARRPEVAPFLDTAVRRALQQRPEDRFPSAAAFAAALAGPPVDQAQDAPPRGRLVSARAAVYAALVMLVVGLAGGSVVDRYVLPQRTSSPGADLAQPAAFTSNQRWAPTKEGGSLTVVDRAGRPQRTIAATRPWTPRFSPDGRRVAYGAFDGFRSTSDLWVTDLEGALTKRLTDDDADSNDPQWNADGSQVAYSVSAPGGKDLLVRALGDAAAHPLAIRGGTQFASDWLRDGSALLVTEQTDDRKRDILVQPADGSTAQPYAATLADETAARISPDGRWVAYTSDESGREEVYLDSYPRPGRRVLISSGGGVHPVWRGDGRELYYWSDGALVALQLGAAGGATPTVEARNVLFRAPYAGGPNTMYDVSPDGERFVLVQQR